MNKDVLNSKIVDIEENFRRSSWKVKKKGRELLNSLEITPPQFTALYTLSKNHNLTIGELSSKMYLACSTVTDLLDRMERNELVVRIKDEKDRRVVRIKVLDKGYTMIENVLENRRNYLVDILKDETDEMVNCVFKVMVMLNGKMKI